MREFPDLPDRMKRLPISEKGFPIPYFAGEDNDGKRDFRLITKEKLQQALDGDRCWVCGERLGKFKAFVIGPMCGINRTISDPPSHRECAIFSAKNCPFLSNPLAKRNERGLDEITKEPDRGVALKRNPGACGVWITKSYKPFKCPITGGLLFEIGDPHEVLWFASGREATRQEVERSIETGLPHLRELCDVEGTEQRRHEAHAELTRRTEEFSKLLPA